MSHEAKKAKKKYRKGLKKAAKQEAKLRAEFNEKSLSLFVNPLGVDATFCQTAGSCVLASYGIASKYMSNGIALDAFFLGYCEHFGLDAANANSAETLYAVHFDREWRRRQCRGYELMLELHETSKVSIFVAMRSLMTGQFLLETNPSVLEKQLRTTESFLNVCYEKSEEENHSISVFSDGRYLFARDTNLPHCYLLPHGLAGIGKLRDSVLYSRKK